MKVRMIAVFLTFALASGLAVSAQENTTAPPAPKQAQSQAQPQEPGTAKACCACCQQCKKEIAAAQGEAVVEGCCHGKNGAAGKRMACCQGKAEKDKNCCQSTGRDCQSAMICCVGKAAPCCGKEAAKDGSKPEKNCCLGA